MDVIHWSSLDISIIDTAVYDNPILAYKWFYFISETTIYNVWIIKGVKMIRVDLKKYESPEGSFEIGDSKFDIRNTIIREFKWFCSTCEHSPPIRFNPDCTRPDYVKTGSRRQTILKICFDIKIW